MQCQTGDYTQEQLLEYTVGCALTLQPFLKEDLPHLNFELAPISAERFYADDLRSMNKRDLKAAYKASSQKFAELKIHVTDWKAGDSSEGEAVVIEKQIRWSTLESDDGFFTHFVVSEKII